MFIEYIKPLVDDLNAFNSRPEDLKPTISPGPAPASRRDTSSSSACAVCFAQSPYVIIGLMYSQNLPKPVTGLDLAP
jgi:hypothetical protein